MYCCASAIRRWLFQGIYTPMIMKPVVSLIASLKHRTHVYFKVFEHFLFLTGRWSGVREIRRSQHNGRSQANGDQEYLPISSCFHRCSDAEIKGWSQYKNLLRWSKVLENPKTKEETMAMSTWVGDTVVTNICHNREIILVRRNR